MNAVSGRDLVDAGLCGVAALLLYVALGQQTFYKIDGHLYLAYVLNGERSYPRHFLYLPMLFLARDAGALLGLSLYESARALSACGAACGVALLHLANRRLGLARRDARLATGLCATLPSVIFFATVVEVHGSFMPFVGGAAWCAASLAMRPNPLRAAVLGLACALAFCAHSTGALLPAVFMPLLLVYPAPRPAWRAGRVPVLTTAVAITLGIATTPLLAKLIGVDFDLRHSSEFATDRARDNLRGLWRYGQTLWHEWLLPMLPLSALLPLGLLVRRLRVQTAWLLVAALIYLFATLMILGGEAEYGAYLLPFAWPLALLAVRSLPRLACIAVLATQLAVGVALVRQHDDPGPTLAYADGARTLAGDAHIALLAGDDLDLRALFLQLPQAERVPLFELARLPAGAASAAADRLNQAVASLLARGSAVLLSDRARTSITEFPAVTPCGQALLTMLDTSYASERSRHPGFAGCRLRQR